MWFRCVEYSLYVCIVATILTRLTCSAVRPYKHIGCYEEYDSHRALPEYLGYVSYDSAIAECAELAKSKGYNTFGIYYQNECYSGPNADSTYSINRKSTECSNGVGAYKDIDVYQFTDEILWPQGTFSLLKPSPGCPSDWVDNGWVIQDTVDNVKNNRSSVLNIDGHVTSNYVVRSFCTKAKRDFTEWPEGQYCIYKQGKTPTNMKDGWITMDSNGKNGRKSSLNLKYKDGIKRVFGNYYDLRSYFFCQTSGAKSQAIDLPITHPFYLLPYGSTECQQVKWMVATTEWIQYATLNYQGQTGMESGSIPHIEIGSESHKGLKMFYCFYESCNKTLSDMKGSFQSPRFPDKYPDGQLCSWKIQVPANHTVHVNFTTFSLVFENDDDTDVLEYYTSTRGSLQLVKDYRGRLESFKVHSTSDLMFVFRSNQADSSSGFNAEYHIIPDQEPTAAQSTEPASKSTTEVQTTTNYLTETNSAVQQSHNSAKDSTTGIPSPTETHPSLCICPTNVSLESKDLPPNSLKDDRGGTGTTTILIVIPLVCFILVLVVTIGIIYRCRLSSRLKAQQDEARNSNNEEDAENPTYGRSPVSIPMTNVDSTTTANVTTKDEDNDQSYEILSRNVLPKHDVPEQYDRLNDFAHPNTATADYYSCVSLMNDGPVYQTLEGPNSEPVVEDQMTLSDHDDVDEKNTLYDNVA